MAAPVATYWLVGDQSSRGLSPQNADYAASPPGWSAGAVKVAGIGALCVAVVALGWLGFAVRKGLLRREWLGVVGLLAGSASVLAVGYRIATAAVIGANIGVGFFMMLGLPLCVGLCVWAATISYNLAGPRVIDRRLAMIGFGIVAFAVALAFAT
jgi:hypothetical protein